MDMRVKYKYVTILIIVFICLINLSRFLFLEVSPPGFYTDEAAGATQALCIAQSGYDFYGQFLPLFPRGFEGGVFSRLFISMVKFYGQRYLVLPLQPFAVFLPLFVALPFWPYIFLLKILLTSK